MKTTGKIVLGAVTLSLLGAACGSDDKTSSESQSSGGEAVCPKNIVIQTDWYPEAEHGGTYQLIGPNGTADKATVSYKGPIQSQYAVGGVETVEIRAGGGAIQFTPVTAQMYIKDEITFGYVNTSDAAKAAKDNPVIGVAKTLELNPQMLQWDPAQLTIETPEDFAASGAKVLHFSGTTYMDYLVSKGYVTAAQVDPSYDGSPGAWIADGGNFIQQGFATNEVYKYENEIQWKNGAPAPVKYMLVDALGFHDYPAMLSVRKDKLEALKPCLQVLVPKMQQAWVDYLKNPKPVNDALIKINETHDGFWKVSEPLNAAAVEKFSSDKIAVNGTDGKYCGFDEARVQGLLDLLKPVFAKQGLDTGGDVKLDQVVDNEFCKDAPGL